MAQEEIKKVPGQKFKELRFFAKVALFSAPIIVVLSLPIIALYGSGEYTPWDAIAERMQGTQPVIAGLSFSNPVYYLDLKNTLAEKPQLIVLGSSRAGLFRSDFFNPNTKVLIDAHIIQNMNHLNTFLDDIPASSSPKVIIVALDQKFFDPNYNVLAFGPSDIQPLLEQSSSPVLGNLWAQLFQVYDYYLTGKISFASLFQPESPFIGLGALVSRSGLRNDGSADYASTTPLDDAPYGIAQGTKGFEYSATISQPALQELGQFLAECQARHIHVVGFTPPLSPSIYARVTSLGDKYGYLNAITPDASAVFNKYGFTFYNFTDPQTLGLTAKEMRDSIHMTERGSLIALIKMAQNDTTLQQYADPTILAQKLNSTQKEVDVMQ